jgi:hypothetical protein
MSASLGDANKMLSDAYAPRIREQIENTNRAAELLKKFERKHHYEDGPEPDTTEFDSWKSMIEPLIQLGFAKGWLHLYGGWDEEPEIEYLPPRQERKMIYDESVQEWRDRQRTMLNADGTVTFKVNRREDV